MFVALGSASVGYQVTGSLHARPKPCGTGDGLGDAVSDGDAEGDADGDAEAEAGTLGDGEGVITAAAEDEPHAVTRSTAAMPVIR